MRFSSAVRIVFALAFACLASAAIADGSGRAVLLGSFTWHMDQPWFGGWSGIELSADGRRMTAITDRGHALRADITRNDDRITAITVRRDWQMKASTGRFLKHKVADSEGLALAPDGTNYVSFERVTRLAHYNAPGASARVLLRHKDFRAFPENKSLESLAIDPKGRLFAIPERLKNDRIPVYVLDRGKWSTPFILPGGNDFLPVGADFGPDGRLYLLERWWSVLGFRSRVRSWDITGNQPRDETLLLQTAIGKHDNLEGLAVWRDRNDRTRLTMIADDNFLALQRSEIVEYVLPE